MRCCIHMHGYWRLHPGVEDLQAHCRAKWRKRIQWRREGHAAEPMVSACVGDVAVGGNASGGGGGRQAGRQAGSVAVAAALNLPAGPAREMSVHRCLRDLDPGSPTARFLVQQPCPAWAFHLPFFITFFITFSGIRHPSIMALLANATAALPTGLCRLSSRSPSSLLSLSAPSPHRSSASFASSSVFGTRLAPSLVGFTLGNYASAKSFRRMDTVSASSAAASVKGGSSIYDFVVKDISGREVEMSVYKGKVLLIVNVASACGLTTTNYKELAEIYGLYKDQDFEVLAFPCNQFGGQEPGTNEQIKEFACTRFKAEYPIFDKVNVNGSQEAPIYKFLKSQKGGGLLGDSIKWNFAKFLVDKNGNVVDRYAPTTPPSKIEKDIKKYLSS